MVVKKKNDNKKYGLLHADSSDASEQSRFWSHIHANGIHSPVALRHVNSSDEQTLTPVFCAFT